MSYSITDIIAFEQGELDYNKTLLLFSNLIASGDVWKLQGSYGRTAQHLINNNYIDNQGNIL